MKVCKPDYYDTFMCVADQCRFTCCRDWTIAVDDITMKKWHKLKMPDGFACDKEYLSDLTRVQPSTCAIKLLEDGTCPFLNENGLCRIVLQYGEETLSQTCHTFPRERHEHMHRVEYALSLGCRSVLEHLWKKKDFQVVITEDADEEIERFSSHTPEVCFMIRDWFVEIAADRSVSVPDVLRVLFYLILDLDELNEKTELTTEAFLTYRNSEIASLLIEKVKSIDQITMDTFNENNELLLDIAENYRKKKIYADYLEPIATHATVYEQALKQNDTLTEEKIGQFTIIWQQYEDHLRTLICEELYASLLLPNSNIYCMIIKLQWLALEYVVIRQWLFLHWDLTGSLEEQDLIEAVSVIFRMTGYSDDDIEEYLESSFESVIWEWGYLSFIL
ncbi:MAG: hypothetical protein GX567_01775 [Clostridia bacterium]|nr:hypothetical protein [Clostridia bacterium]